jgi:hypothetical protein
MKEEWTHLVDIHMLTAWLNVVAQLLIIFVVVYHTTYQTMVLTQNVR